MKICATFILLTLLCPGGCPVYDFDIKTIEEPSEFSNGLKLQSELNKEIEQGLLRIGKDMDAQINPQPHIYYGNSKKYYTGFPKPVSANEDAHTHLQSKSHSPTQHKLKENAKNDDQMQFSLKENNEHGQTGAEEITDTDSDANDDIEDENNSTETEPKTQRYTQTSLEGEIPNFFGTNLFDGTRRYCFSSEDVALLTARKDFERLIPKDLPYCLLNDKAVNILLHYFYGASQIVQRVDDDISKRYIEKAFYDMLGGYLKFYMLPVAKYSFYAGELSLKTVTNVVALYEQCKVFLNTKGNGWKSPSKRIYNDLKNLHLKPLKVLFGSEAGDDASYCARLDMSTVNNDDAEDDQMIVSLPKLEAEDTDGLLGNIWLPFKRKHTYNLRSSKAKFIVVKFYEAVTRCYRFQSIPQEAYNQKFKTWILENIQVHFSDDQFYPGLGAVLWLYENLKRGKNPMNIREVGGMSENDDFMESLEESTKHKKDASDFNNLFFDEPQEIEDSSWLTMNFGKRDNKDKKTFSKHDNDDIYFDDDDYDEFEDEKIKDFESEVAALVLNRTQSEHKDHSRNATSEYVPDNEEQFKAMCPTKDKQVLKDKEIDNDKDEEQMSKFVLLQQKAKDKQKEKETETKHQKKKHKGNEIELKEQNETQYMIAAKLLKNWICLAILFLIVLLLFLLCCVKAWKKIKSKRKPMPCMVDEEVETEPEPEPESEPFCFVEVPKKKRRTICDCFASKKKEEDEVPFITCNRKKCIHRVQEQKICDDVVLVEPESTCVLGPTNIKRCSTTSSSSSSSTQICQPPKCVPLFAKGVRHREKGRSYSPTKTRTDQEVVCPRPKVDTQKQKQKCDAAIIETTSLDCSSSESEKYFKKICAEHRAKPKTVTIVEKRNKGNCPTPTTCKTKTKENCDDVKRVGPRIGIQRTVLECKKKPKITNDDCKRSKDKTQSTSWETMYDT